MPSTPITTPRRPGETSHDDVAFPSQGTIVVPTGWSTAVRHATPIARNSDESAMHQPNLGLSAVDMSTSYIAAAQHMSVGHKRSVMPLPATLSAAPGASSSVRNMSDGSIVVVPAAGNPHASMHHSAVANTTTFSSQAKKRASSAHRGRSVDSSRRLDHSIHTLDAQCCGFKNREAHANQPRGVFVTFCDESVESKVDRAMRDLECERDSRSSDEHRHQVQMIKMLRDLKAAEELRDKAATDFLTLKTTYDKETAEGRIVRDEFERRWKHSEELREQELQELTALRKAKEDAAVAENARQHERETYEAKIAELKTSLALVERESGENAQRAQMYFEELSMMRKTAAALEKEMGGLRHTLSTRDAILKGMEKELGAAQDRVGAAAMLRSSMRKEKSAASAPSTSTAAGRLQQSMYGR